MTILKLGALLLAILLGSLITIRVFQLALLVKRTPQLSLLPFANGAGDTALDQVGLKELTQEKLLDYVKEINDEVKKATEKGVIPGAALAKERPLPPISAQELHDLLGSLSGWGADLIARRTCKYKKVSSLSAEPLRLMKDQQVNAEARTIGQWS